MSNTSNAGTLPNGTYDVLSVDTANEIHLDDNTGPAGTGYCDVTAPEEIDLYTFSMEHDSVLSRVVVSCYDGQQMYTGSGRSGPVAVFTVSTSVGDNEMYCMNAGGNKSFDLDDVIPGGSTITLKLRRANKERPINASKYRVFIYFRRAL